MLLTGGIAAFGLLRRLARTFASKNGAESVGVVFDLDGVIYRNSPAGAVVIPGTFSPFSLSEYPYTVHVIAGVPDAIQRLHASKIPFAFMTNGTGYTEAEKAKKISSLIGLPVNPENVVTCTTPFRRLTEKYSKSRVLVVGGSETIRIAREYGFVDCIGLREYVASRRQLVPHLSAQNASDNGTSRSTQLDGRKISAIFVFNEPDDWHIGLQVMCDVLASDGEPCEELGGHASLTQVVDLYFSNPDFTYPTSHSGEYFLWV